MVANGIDVAAAGIRQPDTLRADRVQVESIVASAADLDEFQFFRLRQQRVVPKASANHDVAIANSLSHFLPCPSLETGNSGAARLEGGRELISGVGEMDGDLFQVHGPAFYRFSNVARAVAEVWLRFNDESFWCLPSMLGKSFPYCRRGELLRASFRRVGGSHRRTF